VPRFHFTASISFDQLKETKNSKIQKFKNKSAPYELSWLFEKIASLSYSPKQ
jgi:hypothetical protein